MISQDEQSAKPKEQPDGNSSVASKGDLFGYGVAAKISGVEGRGTGEFALIVEGIARIRIDKYTQERPFFEAEVTYLYDDGRCYSTNAQALLLIGYSNCRRRCCRSRPLRASKATVP
jgi:Lon protease-like protein